MKGRDTVVQTPFGRFLTDERDVIESTLKAGTLWDGPGFLQVLVHEYGDLGQRDVTILDVGANVGSFSIYCAYHGAWRVVAFEPVPSTMQRLKANLDLNQDTCANRVIPIQVAGYHKNVPLFAPPVNPTNVGGTALSHDGPIGDGCVVDGKRLEGYASVFGRRVSLIKIDAQGCDGAALLGLERVIRRDHPVIIFEWEPELARQHYPSFEQITAALEHWGYEVQPWPTHPNNYVARWQPPPPFAAQDPE